MKLPKHVINLYRFTSTDETRVALQHVCIEYTAGNAIATAVATDGHRLVYLEFDMGGFRPTDGKLYLHRDVLKNIKLGKDGVANLNDGYITATAKGATTRYDASYDLQGYSYPTWRRCLDGAPDDDATPCSIIGVNARYLADFADYLKACGVDYRVGFEMPADDISVMAMTAHGDINGTDDKTQAIRYLLMPMRL
jgi:DNA polymerase III sliding clamp (beta) subunit (PCNA family)